MFRFRKSESQKGANDQLWTIADSFLCKHVLPCTRSGVSPSRTVQHSEAQRRKRLWPNHARVHMPRGRRVCVPVCSDGVPARYGANVDSSGRHWRCQHLCGRRKLRTRLWPRLQLVSHTMPARSTCLGGNY